MSDEEHPHELISCRVGKPLRASVGSTEAILSDGRYLEAGASFCGELNRFAVGQRLRPCSFRDSTSQPETSSSLASTRIPRASGSSSLLPARLRSSIMKAAD
jgi:hypothetical protein